MLVRLREYSTERGELCGTLLQTHRDHSANSNNHVNMLISHPFEHDFRHPVLGEELMAHYVSFLKTLSLKLNVATVQFFFNNITQTFPLYTRALPLFDCDDKMVRTAVRTVTLNVFNVKDDAMRAFVLGEDAPRTKADKKFLERQSALSTPPRKAGGEGWKSDGGSSSPAADSEQGTKTRTSRSDGGRDGKEIGTPRSPAGVAAMLFPKSPAMSMRRHPSSTVHAEYFTKLCRFILQQCARIDGHLETVVDACFRRAEGTSSVAYGGHVPNVRQSPFVGKVEQAVASLVDDMYYLQDVLDIGWDGASRSVARSLARSLYCPPFCAILTMNSVCLPPLFAIRARLNESMKRTGNLCFILLPRCRRASQASPRRNPKRARSPRGGHAAALRGKVVRTARTSRAPAALVAGEARQGRRRA